MSFSLPFTLPTNGVTSALDDANSLLSNSSQLGTGGNFLSGTTSATSTSKSTSSNATQQIPPIITQTERLFTTRSRSINYQDGGGNRGQRTFIKVISNDPATSLKRHLSDIAGQTTSLGNSSGGALADAINNTSVFGGYADFLVTDINCSFDEKMQVTEVFGDGEVVYYFGRQPMVVEFGGMLIDSPDNNWFIQFVEMYSEALRGSQLARNYELLKIVTPNMTFIGTVTRMSYRQNSDRDVDIPFQFSFLVKQVIPNPIITPGAPSSNSSVLNTDKVASFQTQGDIVSIKQRAAGLQGVIQNPFSTTQDYASALSAPTPLGGSDNTTGTSTSYASTANLSPGTAHTPDGTNGANSPGLFSNVTSNLTGMRASLFSPVYGVLSSLTKLVSSTTNSVTSVISSFTTPIQNMLRDVKNISNQAVGVVNMINNSIQSVTNIGRQLDNDVYTTMASLKHTAGVITSAPQSIASNLRDMISAGTLPASRSFLQNRPGTTLPNGKTNTASKITLLNSGAKHTPQSGATL